MYCWLWCLPEEVFPRNNTYVYIDTSEQNMYTSPFLCASGTLLKFQCKVLNATMVEHVVNPLPQIIPKRVIVLDGIPSLNGSCLWFCYMDYSIHVYYYYSWETHCYGIGSWFFGIGFATYVPLVDSSSMIVRCSLSLL